MVLFLIAGVFRLNAQKWVDTTYAYTLSNVTYGTSIDFAGNNRVLDMDICVPNNDQPPTCGRPLLIAIHGGSFMAGSKNDASLQRIMKDFAKRGYVTASINYRLGTFQTDNQVHCNVTQLFNVAWDCSNLADTAEWYRGCYRGILDARGAIRYLINNQSTYNIDPRNVFLVGESAGGFIALGAAYLDTAVEKHPSCDSIKSVNAPNSIYENTCVKQFQWDTSIASMRLTRPNLGPISGQLNNSANKYIIKGVGNFYGGMFPGWLQYSSQTKPAALYLYHQPNDLIVPYGRDKVLAGFSNCFTGFGCSQIINRPIIYGSSYIKKEIVKLKSQGANVPDCYFDSTTNNADCATQGFNPALSGHSIDNFNLRTKRMAQYFAPMVDTSNNCLSAIFANQHMQSSVSIYPNPFQHSFSVQVGSFAIKSLELFDVSGKQLLFNMTKSDSKIVIEPSEALNSGIYFIKIHFANGYSCYYRLLR